MENDRRYLWIRKLPLSADCKAVLAFIYGRFSNGDDAYIPYSPYDKKEELMLKASGVLEVLRELMDKGYVRRGYSEKKDEYGFTFDTQGARRNLGDIVVRQVMTPQAQFRQPALAVIRNPNVWDWTGRTKGAHITICRSEGREAPHRFYLRPWFATEEAWLIEDVRDIDSLKEEFLRFSVSTKDIEKSLSAVSGRVGDLCPFYARPEEDSVQMDDFSMPPLPFPSG